MEPIIPGTDLELEFTFPGYPQASHQIEIALRGPAVIDIKDGSTGVTISGEGDTYRISVTAAATGAWISHGIYWYAIVLKNTPHAYQVESGSVEILRNISGISATYDGRSHVKKTLDAIEAVIEGRASSGEMSYTIAGRQISKIPIPDLLTMRDKYKSSYNEELKAEKLAKGENIGGKIYVRF